MTDISNAIAALTRNGSLPDAKNIQQPKVGGQGFGDMLEKAMRSSADTLRAGEAASADAVQGKGNIQQLVGTITQAELMLETVVAVRDRAVSAYQELMRMQM